MQEEEEIKENEKDMVDSDNDTLIGDIEQNTTVSVSLYQIYNENVNDLLGDPNKNLKIR